MPATGGATVHLKLWYIIFKIVFSENIWYGYFIG